MRPIKIIKKADIESFKSAHTKELVCLGQGELKNADLVVLRKNWLKESTANLHSQRTNDLAVFGIEGRLGEILCLTNSELKLPA